MRGSEKTIVPTEVESGAVIKSAASHYKHSLIQRYESRENINNRTRPTILAKLQSFIKFEHERFKKSKTNTVSLKKNHKSSLFTSTI